MKAVVATDAATPAGAADTDCAVAAAPKAETVDVMPRLARLSRSLSSARLTFIRAAFSEILSSAPNVRETLAIEKAQQDRFPVLAA